MPNLNIPLNILGTEVQTILPDGSVFASSLTDTIVNTIGERKRYIWKLSVTAFDLETVNLWVKVAIFNQGILNSLTPKVPIDYAITFPVGLTPGIYPMALMMPFGANIALNSNADVYLEILTSTTFNIFADFYQIYDETTYMDQYGQDNHAKMLRDLKSSLVDLYLSPTKSCYNSNVSLFSMTARLEKPNVLFPPDTFLYTMNANPAVGSTWLAGFYNRNSSDSDPYFHTPIWEFTRSATAVTNLSTYVNTDVLFKITSPTTVTKVLFWIIRTDKFDNNVDMWTNYEANFEDIISSNTNIGLDKLTTPVVNISAIGGGVFQVGCSIAADKIVNNAKYRLIAIVYDNDGSNYFANSFISDELIADSNPCFNGDGFSVIGALSDYDRQFDGNDLECAIEERIRSTVRIDFPFNSWKNDIFNRLGLTTTNDIRRYLTKITFDIYDEATVLGYGIVKNFYESKTSNKIGVNTFSAQSGMTLNFGTNWAEFTFDFRNRFEDLIDCIESTINDVPVTPVLSDQYWGGKTLKLRWRLFFTYDDFSNPFTDEIEILQQIRVKDYGDMRVQHENTDSGRENFDETVNCCHGDEFCMAGILTNPADAIPRKLIVNVCPEFGSVTSINEAEAWIGNQLPQLTTPEISSEDVDYTTIYSEKAARFCIDTSKLSVNSYKITAFAKKYVDVGKRVTEKGNPSVFKQRIIEANSSKRTTDNI